MEETLKTDSRYNEGSCKISGIQTNNRKNTIRFNHFGSNKYAQKYEGVGIQVGCNFMLYLKLMHTIKQPIEKPNKPAEKRVINRLDRSRETCIVTQPNSIRPNSSCWQHDDQCCPSTQNLIMSNERSGQYLKYTCSSKNFTL